MNIIGAGMAGLLAAAMLRSKVGRVYEKQRLLPNNHSAVLRFRSSVVGDVLNVPFKKVDVLKAVLPWSSPVADMHAYSIKTNGNAEMRSILSASGVLVQRYVAPPDFIQQMYSMVEGKVIFGCDVFDEFSKLRSPQEWKSEGPFISTIPMPAMMGLLGWEPISIFRSVVGYNINIVVDGLNTYTSLYVPDPKYPFSRISTTGDLITAEFPCPTMQPIEVEHKIKYWRDHPEEILPVILGVLGLQPLKKIKSFDVSMQKYFKILPIDENERRNFIMWATQEFGVYSLGRYATWRPNLLLDDIVNDVRVIQNLASNPSAVYSYKKDASQ